MNFCQKWKQSLPPRFEKIPLKLFLKLLSEPVLWLAACSGICQIAADISWLAFDVAAGRGQMSYLGCHYTAPRAHSLVCTVKSSSGRCKLVMSHDGRRHGQSCNRRLVSPCRFGWLRMDIFQHCLYTAVGGKVELQWNRLALFFQIIFDFISLSKFHC